MSRRCAGIATPPTRVTPQHKPMLGCCTRTVWVSRKIIPRRCAGIAWQPTRVTPPRKTVSACCITTARGRHKIMLRRCAGMAGLRTRAMLQRKTNIGLLYDNGLGVAQDYAVAIRWYRKAADQTDATAQNNIGA